MWLLLAGAARAADLLVPSQYATLQAAVNAAGAGDRVVVTGGPYSGDVDVTGISLTIVGEGSAVTTLSGGGGGETIRIRGGGELTLQDLAVTTSGARRCVGVEGSTLHLAGVRLHRCGNNGNGGAVHADTGSVVTIDGSTFEDNDANRGSHVYFWGSTLDIADSSFLRGDGGSEGGIQVSSGADLTLRRSLLQGNVGGGNGGALAFDGGDALVEDCTFEGNHADGNGGAIDSGGASRITILGSLFVGNSATVRAGALDLSGVPDLEVRRNVFCDNVGGSSTSGAIRLYDVGYGSDYVWANNVFQGNFGPGPGGGLYVTGARVRLENSTFVSNDTNGTGGALSLTSSALGDVELVNSVVLDTLGGSGVDVGTGASVFLATFTDWWANVPGHYSGNLLFTPGATNLFVDPALQTWTGDCLTDELWPAIGSPLVDAGDPSILDADGSASDLGAWGGPDPICALSEYFVDGDGDGHGTGAPATRACATPPGHADDDLDCDDADPAVGIDRTWYLDGDGDGQGAASQSTLACAQPAGHVANATDCDDADAGVFVGAVEVCGGGDEDCDGLADDLDPTLDLGTGGTWYVDGDGDGVGGTAVQACLQPLGTVSAAGDCDDADAATRPGAAEVCGGGDDDCDGLADDADPGVVGAPAWFTDADGDGFGDLPVTACVRPAGTAVVGGDCDDLDLAVHPGAAEICGGGDEDCDGLADDADPGVTDAVDWYVDADGDGVGAGISTSACAAPVGSVASSGDCDDGDPTVHPGATEQCNGIDDDCDLVIDDAVLLVDWHPDTDGDGFGDPNLTVVDCLAPGPDWTAAGGDCDDADPAISPAAAEVCGGGDEDCDGLVDEADPSVGGVPSWYGDGDGDGFGVLPPIVACTAPAGTAPSQGDCDDLDPLVNPDAAEVCGGGDEDCDGLADDADPGLTGAPGWYDDLDGDGFGGGLPVLACVPPVAAIPTGGDCDDADVEVNPLAVEVCGGADEDCDGLTDDADPSVDPLGTSPWYADADGDLFGDPLVAVAACVAPPGYVADATDCDDAERLAHPGGVEVCNLADDDCNGIVDDALAFYDWTFDADGDGFGDDALVQSACADPGPDWSLAGGDCDDGDAAVYPAATEACDGADTDCDGVVPADELDADGDGATACQGDCDDLDGAVFVGADERCDGADEDCDGQIDEDPVDGVLSWPDADGDGFGDAAAAPTLVCEPGADEVLDGTDCDDADAAVNPDAAELEGNGADDDCDPATSDDPSGRPDAEPDTGGKAPSGCSCTTSGGAPWLAALLPLASLVRRRRGPPRGGWVRPSRAT